MKKLSLKDLEKGCNWKRAVVVFKQESFDVEYDEVSRSYEIERNAKYFNPQKTSKSLVGDCLDGTDRGVRLDWYINDRWFVDYCYVLD